MSMPREIIAALVTGLARELARELDLPVKDTACRHGAWFIAVGGFGLTCEQVGRAEDISKQAVSEANARTADRCEDRAYERKIIKVAETFGVSL